MSLISLAGLDALFNHRSQPQSYWKDTAERIRTGVVLPHHQPRFTFVGNAALFAIGSCFARRIEKAFLRQEMNCTSALGFNSASQRLFGNQVNVNYANKYSTHSILNELRWALDKEIEFPRNAIVQLADGCGIDLQASPHLGELSLPAAKPEEVYERHLALLSGVTSQLRTADIFVITLGLVEFWKDQETGLNCNAGLLAELLEKEPNRFTFEVSTFAENMENLEQIYALLAKHCKPNLKIIVTTSPVPMAATFSGRDIPTANCYSKSVLRAVAEEWQNRHDNIDYFPSYEMATISDRQIVWETDLIHVRDSFADVIVRQFAKNYFPNLVEPSHDLPPVPGFGSRVKKIGRQLTRWM